MFSSHVQFRQNSFCSTLASFECQFSPSSAMKHAIVLQVVLTNFDTSSGSHLLKLFNLCLNRRAFRFVPLSHLAEQNTQRRTTQHMLESHFGGFSTLSIFFLSSVPRAPF